MRRHPAIPSLLIGPAALAIGLAGCHPQIHEAQRVAAMSRPAPDLLAGLPEPDCETTAAAPVTKAKAETRTAGKPTGEDAAEASETKADDETETAKADETPKAEADEPEAETAEKPDEPKTETAKPAETSTSIMAAAAAEGEQPKPADSEEALRKQRDCYRSAEQRARTQLQQLQASTAEAFDAMDAAKHRRQARGPVYRHPNDGSGPHSPKPHLSLDQLRERGS